MEEARLTGAMVRSKPSSGKHYTRRSRTNNQKYTRWTSAPRWQGAEGQDALASPAFGRNQEQKVVRRCPFSPGLKSHIMQLCRVSMLASLAWPTLRFKINLLTSSLILRPGGKFPAGFNSSNTIIYKTRLISSRL